MANVAATERQHTVGAFGKDVQLDDWTLTGTDTGVLSTTGPTYVQNPQGSDRSVQVSGTFGGGTVLIEGSNDGSNWFTLTDPTGAALSFAAAGLKQILELTRYIRPRASVAVTSVNVNLVAKR
jgi:hypothetical protein